MVKKIIRHYYDFFDKKLENGTIIVCIIALGIFAAIYFATGKV